MPPTRSPDLPVRVPTQLHLGPVVFGQRLRVNVLAVLSAGKHRTAGSCPAGRSKHARADPVAGQLRLGPAAAPLTMVDHGRTTTVAEADGRGVVELHRGPFQVVPVRGKTAVTSRRGYGEQRRRLSLRRADNGYT
jgi:hypothetical protein